MTTAQRPKKKFPRHWYDADGNIITIPFCRLLPITTIDYLRRKCREYGIPDYEIEDRRSKVTYVRRLQKEFFARIEAKNQHNGGGNTPA
jgi:hypothetical protein